MIPDSGLQVVSRTISADECRQLGAVIKRRPILWDNLHANDYDHQRLYLGPYLGRDKATAALVIQSDRLTLGWFMVVGPIVG